MDRHLAFLNGEQKQYLRTIIKESGLKNKKLAELIGIHPRTLLDWKREKYHISLSAARIFEQKFRITLPEAEDVLVSRWEQIRKDASIKGGIALFKKHGILATKEGREKGGKISWLKRRQNPLLLEKYVKKISIPEESVDLANLTGIVLGDGGLTHFQCTIYLSSETDQEFAYYVKDLFIKLFGISPRISRHKTAKMLKVSVSSVNLVQYLLGKGLVLGNKVHLQVGVPRWIFKRNDYVAACIRGLVDTDGCFIVNTYKVKGKKYSYPKMIFANRSLPLLDFVCDGLRSLGFSPREYYGKHVWLANSKEVRSYLNVIGTNNYKPNIKTILESGLDGKAQVR